MPCVAGTNSIRSDKSLLTNDMKELWGKDTREGKGGGGMKMESGRIAAQWKFPFWNGRPGQWMCRRVGELYTDDITSV